jgi:hypothetical protein
LSEQARGFHLVGDAHAFSEAFDGEGFDVCFVELVLVDKFQDQILLLVGAFPGRAALPVRHLGDVGGL